MYRPIFPKLVGPTQNFSLQKMVRHLNTQDFWDMTPLRLVHIYERFGGAYYFCLLGSLWFIFSWTERNRLLGTSATSYHSEHCNISEDLNLYQHRRKNLRFCTVWHLSNVMAMPKVIGC